MRVHFGPSLTHQLKMTLHYATKKCEDSDHIISSYDEDEKSLFTFVKDGTIILDDGLKIFIEHKTTVHAIETCIIQEVYGYFEADSLDTIRKFFEAAAEYTKDVVNINKDKDKVKILNFDYRWECDSMINKKSFGSIHLPKKILGDFKSDIENFLSDEAKKRYELLELTPSRIYALYGPPGTGKTTLIHCTASGYSMNIATLSFDSHMNDRTFKMALKKIPSDTILCLEDIDCIFNESRKSNETCVTFSGLINGLDGICKIKNLIIFLTTNHIERLDPALKRRIDYFVKFDFCTKEQVSEMFKRFLPTEDFELFWAQCSKLKVTPSILQKFFICNLYKPFESYYKNIKEFVESEHGLEKLPDMYT